MSALDQYFKTVQAQLAEIHATQRKNLEQAADWVVSALVNERFIYTFGSGHSHTLAEETFYRAGGLVRAAAILDEKLMVHVSASESTEWERKEGYAAQVLNRYPLGPDDVLFVVSNSGRNAVPIEMALEGAKRGAKTVAITSSQHSSSITSRHSSGKKLSEIAHLAIDNQSIEGDACVQITGLPQRVAPTSTITSAFIINSIIVEAVERAVAMGHRPEVYTSINSEGTSNEDFLARYKKLIRHL